MLRDGSSYLAVTVVLTSVLDINVPATSAGQFQSDTGRGLIAYKWGRMLCDNDIGHRPVAGVVCWPSVDKRGCGSVSHRWGQMEG